MRELEVLLGLVLAAVILAAFTRRVGAPYPVFLALGGALIAFLPGAPSFTLPPELVLALFIAPVLLDAAYDASLRDLRDNWVGLTELVVFAVGLTTAGVALVARALVPEMPWAAALALGALVAPPDAAAAASHPHNSRRREPAERCERAPDLPARGGSCRSQWILHRRGCAYVPARRGRQPGGRACAGVDLRPFD